MAQNNVIISVGFVNTDPLFSELGYYQTSSIVLSSEEFEYFEERNIIKWVISRITGEKVYPYWDQRLAVSPADILPSIENCVLSPL